MDIDATTVSVAAYWAAVLVFAGAIYRVSKILDENLNPEKRGKVAGGIRDILSRNFWGIPEFLSLFEKVFVTRSGRTGFWRSALAFRPTIAR